MANALLADCSSSSLVFGLYSSSFSYLEQTNTSVWAAEQMKMRDEAESSRVAFAAQLTVLCGLMEILLHVLRCGGGCQWLSQPLVSGYTTAAAVHVTVHQLPLLLDISIDRYRSVLSVVWVVDFHSPLHFIICRLSGTLIVSSCACSDGLWKVQVDKLGYEYLPSLTAPRKSLNRSLVSASIILFILLKFSPLFQQLPKVLNHLNS
ncbi:putative solute carrier family 26 member 6-like [Triplophysa rosa]|uniref:Solute carrier family 26 member 6-like n=1 Tax=Triplophysa rosa TaxID=992332 RepID=A0A9W7WFT0_TRIRA|nr:putative solute carrier family 26 member 6-like [Triplophysa rosa]